jgi:hypothetical protein
METLNSSAVVSATAKSGASLAVSMTQLGSRVRAVVTQGAVTVLAAERAEAEDTTEQRPAEGDVGDEDGGGQFADVPVQEDGTEGNAEVVVTIQDGSEDDEDTEREDTAKDQLSTSH